MHKLPRGNLEIFLFQIIGKIIANSYFLLGQIKMQKVLLWWDLRKHVHFAYIAFLCKKKRIHEDQSKQKSYLLK